MMGVFVSCAPYHREKARWMPLPETGDARTASNSINSDSWAFNFPSIAISGSTVRSLIILLMTLNATRIRINILKMTKYRQSLININATNEGSIVQEKLLKTTHQVSSDYEKEDSF
jgi:hypothetical protein